MIILKFFKNLWGQLHRFVLWALLLTLFWCWIYTFVGETTRAKKVLIYVDAYELDSQGLSERLEDDGLPEGIKVIQIRSFAYHMFRSTLEGDAYLMKESLLKATLEETPGKLTAIEVPEGFTGYEWEGETWAIQVYDAAAQTGTASEYIRYLPYGDEEVENFYLCFDAESPHVEGLPNAIDNAAWEVVRNLLSLND